MFEYTIKIIMIEFVGVLCMCVCVYESVCLCVYISVCVYVWVYVCVYEPVCLFTCMCVRVCECVCVRLSYQVETIIVVLLFWLPAR